MNAKQIGDYIAEYCELFHQFRINSANVDNFYYWLTPLSRCDTVDNSDTTLAMPQIRILEESQDHCHLTAQIESSIWDEKQAHFIFTPDGMEHYVTIKGKGRLERQYFFLGLLNGICLGSVGGFDYFVPGCPTFIGKDRFFTNEYFSVNVTNETTYWGLALNSGPLFYSFHKKKTESCFWAGIIAGKGQNVFESFDFNHKPAEVLATHDNIINTQSFSLAYSGHLFVDGQWESPHIFLGHSPDRNTALKSYCQLLEERDAIAKPVPAPAAQSWWRKPIFCGWHEQVAQNYKQIQDTQASMLELETGAAITDMCTQDNYQRWLDILLDQKIPIGTVIIDSKWQKYFATFEVDENKWPDMRGFIDSCHEKNIHVILWQNAWGTEGLGEDECILRSGKSIAADPTSPTYLKRLRSGIEYMLSTDSACLNADGFKIDYTNRIPVGAGFKTKADIYGFELQYTYLKAVYDTTKKVKPDCLISLFTANPYYRDVCDMIRLGDLYSVYGRPVDTLRQRAEIVAIAMPSKPIDTDGNFEFSIATDFIQELCEQVKIGVPTIYNAEYVYQHRSFVEPACTKLTDSDYDRIRRIMTGYINKLQA